MSGYWPIRSITTHNEELSMRGGCEVQKMMPVEMWLLIQTVDILDLDCPVCNLKEKNTLYRRSSIFSFHDKAKLAIILADVAIVKWFMISRNDHFCIPSFIFTEKSY